MRLSLYTDFSLRLLVYLAAADPDVPVSTTAIAQKYRVSAHHMRKVAQGLGRLGYIESLEGRRGGLRMSVPPEELRVGDVVEKLEGIGRLVQCKRGPCPLHGGCALKGERVRAERMFVAELNKVTIADVVRTPGPTVLKLERLLNAA